MKYFSPKGRPFKVIPQAGRYVNLASQAASQRMLFDWLRLQRTTLEWRKKHEDGTKKHQKSISFTYPNVCVGSWAGAQHSCIPKNFTPPYLLAGKATLLIGSVPQV